MNYRELSDEDLKSVIGGVLVTSYASNTSGVLTSTKASATVSPQHTLLVDPKNLLKGKLLSLPTIPTV